MLALTSGGSPSRAVRQALTSRWVRGAGTFVPGVVSSAPIWRSSRSLGVRAPGGEEHQPRVDEVEPGARVDSTACGPGSAGPLAIRSQGALLGEGLARDLPGQPLARS